MTKKILLPVIAISLLFVSCGKVVNTNKKPKTDLDSFSYAFGLMMSKQLKGSGIKQLDYSAFLHGFEDGMSKDSGYAIPSNKLEATLQAYATKAQAKKTKQLQKENLEFLQAKQKEGYKMLPGGSYIKVNKAGTGKISGPYDTIEYRFAYLEKNGNEAEAMKKLQPGRDPMHLLRAGFSDFYDAMQMAPEGSEFVIFSLNEKNESMKRNAKSIEEAFGITKIVFQVIKITPGTKPIETPKKPGAAGQPQLTPEQMEQLQQQMQQMQGGK